MLKVGDKAPSFTLLNQDEQPVSLSQFAGQQVLVWFYPKASTPGCTKEGCSLRDHHEALSSKGVVVLGISKDSPKRQKNFIVKQSFPYDLLSDPEGEVIEGFGAWGRKKFRGREYDGILRSSFLIDGEGTIIKVWDKVKTSTHGEQVLEEL